MVKAGRETIARFCKTQETCMDCVLFGETYGCRRPESMTDSEVEAACELIYDNQALPSLPSQDAKADAGKPRLSLVPSEIIRDIARVREYGNDKYGDPENWKTVEPERYRDAAYGHLLAYIDNPIGTDEESGLPHLWHLACNIAFLCEMEKGAEHEG